MKRYKVVAILAVTLLVISVTINIINHKNSKKYEDAVDVALSYYFSSYNIGSIHRSLNQVIVDGKINFGEVGRTFNYFQREFHELSNIHRELTLIYGPLYTYNQYDKISSVGMNNIFNMFLDFYVFFEYLYKANSNSISVEDERQYLDFSELEDETIEGIQIILEITGELEKMKREGYANKTSDDKNALEDYMIRSAEYFNTPEVQEKVDVIENANKYLISQANI